jgi:hypothetical protein
VPVVTNGAKKCDRLLKEHRRLFCNTHREHKTAWHDAELPAFPQAIKKSVQGIGWHDK